MKQESPEFDFTVEALSSTGVMRALDIRSKESLWRLRHDDPTFPKPFTYRPGGKNFWLRHDISAWLIARATRACDRPIPHEGLKSSGRPPRPPATKRRRRR